MSEFIQMNIPKGRPDGATHYNPRFTLCWEKKKEGTDKVYVYDHKRKNWGNPINRPGGHLIQAN